jgi:hypothetical protein
MESWWCMTKLSRAPRIRKLDSTSDLHTTVAVPPSFIAQKSVRSPNRNTSNKKKTICPTDSPYTSHHVTDKISHQILAKHTKCILLLLYTRSYKASKPASLYMRLVTGGLFPKIEWPVPEIVDSSWNVMAHGDARKGKWKGNWRTEWVASTLHTTSEHDVSSITTADAHTSAASSRLNWRPRRFKRTPPFRQKTKSGFCACAITFQMQSTCTCIWRCVIKVLDTFVHFST